MVINRRQAVDPSHFRDGNPWRVVVDLNEVCNIQCTYCHIDSLFGPAARNARTLLPEQLTALLLDADQMKVFDVTLTGGEITVMRNLTEYLSAIRDLEFTSVQMITNGTLLSEELAIKLKESGLSRVSISIDGLERSNDAARGKRVWARAWKGLENAIAAGLNVNVISVLGMHNIDDWFELPPRLKQAGVRSQNISLMCRLGRAELSEEWLGVPEERLDEVRLKVSHLQEELNDSSFFTSLNDGVLHQPGWTGKPTPIHAFQDQNPGIEAVVKVNGDVLRNRLYGQREPVGNLSNQSLSEIWQADKSRRNELTAVVGSDNLGSLPSLYYHFDGHSRSPVETTIQMSCSIDDQSNYRTRVETWGAVGFDTQTFSITDIWALDRDDS